MLVNSCLPYIKFIIHTNNNDIINNNEQKVKNGRKKSLEMVIHTAIHLICTRHTVLEINGRPVVPDDQKVYRATSFW